MNEDTEGDFNTEESTEMAQSNRRWSLNYLKEQCVHCEEIFLKYNVRLQHGYFSIYLILQFLLSLSYALVIIYSNPSRILDDISPDILLYGSIALTSILTLLLTSERQVKHLSRAFFLYVYAIDTFLPIYNHLHDGENMRTPFTTHLIIASYIFYAFDRLRLAILCGLLVTATHLTITGTITFRRLDADILARKLIIECIYFGCINCVGVYFRYLNEIMYRGSFLARKEQINSKLLSRELQEKQKSLLEAIFPRDIAERIIGNDKMKDYFLYSDKPEPYFFKNEIIKEHKNVTILYADIVNYTKLTTTIQGSLIPILNDLFGGFDEDSEKLGVMRIKFLGDCYYCVSGMTYKNEKTQEFERNENHADSCIQLALRMIARIGEVAKTHKVLDLNMRIGIHTGNMVTALIGKTKWQFEIWSKDVLLANAMESTGFPGKVHITQETMDELIKQKVLEEVEDAPDVLQHKVLGKYFVYRTNVAEANESLAGSTSKTYVVSPKLIPHVSIYSHALYQKEEKQADGRKRNSSTKRTTSRVRGVSEGTTNARVLQRAKSIAKISMAATLGDFKKAYDVTDIELENSIRQLPLSKQEQWFRETDMNPLLLVFKNFGTELKYIASQDHLFKFYVLSIMAVLLCFISIRFVAMPGWQDTALLSILTALSLLPFLPMAVLPVNGREKRRHGNISDGPEIRYAPDWVIKLEEYMPDWYYTFARNFTQNIYCRTALYVVLSSIFAGCFVVELTHCNYQTGAGVKLKDNENCLPPWNITETINLTLIMSFLFLKMYIWLKFAYGTIITVAYCCWVWNYAYDYYDSEPSFHYMMRPPASHIINVIYLTVTLHFIDRQADYLSRLDHKWNLELAAKKKESKMLERDTYKYLTHVLPESHATKFFLEGTKTYIAEKHHVVAVMFATIVEDEPDLSRDDDKGHLMVLNEIISDFDTRLLKDYKGRVDKVKLANMKTYVAAAGLMPGQFRPSDNANEDAELGTRLTLQLNSDQYLLNLLEFAVDIMGRLKEHNKEDNRNRRLRIGICDGKLTAGVVGIKKPNYDIWGDCANIASRMDTLGAPGRIQVNESTYMVLRRNGVSCTDDGIKNVKGKGFMQTYFVDLDENGRLVRFDPKTVRSDDDECREEDKNVDEDKIT